MGPKGAQEPGGASPSFSPCPHVERRTPSPASPLPRKAVAVLSGVTRGPQGCRRGSGAGESCFPICCAQRQITAPLASRTGLIAAELSFLQAESHFLAQPGLLWLRPACCPCRRPSAPSCSRASHVKTLISDTAPPAARHGLSTLSSHFPWLSEDTVTLIPRDTRMAWLHRATPQVTSTQSGQGAAPAPLCATLPSAAPACP